MFVIVRGSAPLYLTDLCNLCNICSDDRLRSASRSHFAQLRTNTKLANKAFFLCVLPFVVNKDEYKAFSVAGPLAWNSLPSRIMSIDSKRSFCIQH